MAKIWTWQQDKALAEWLHERGPMTARYKGEMTDKVLVVLRKQLGPDVVQAQAAATPGRMADAGLVAIEGNRAHATRLTYIGPDPATVAWEPVRPQRAERQSTPDLAARVAELEAKVDRIPEIVRQAVDLALEAWTR